MNTVLQLLTENGHEGFAEGVRLLVDEAMRRERASALQAQPYERTAARLGHANGFKLKTLSNRLGLIQFQIPQVRAPVEFYPSALEKGVRSEQALKLALAEMYVQGVSTRKVSAIVEQLCGTSVSSTQVSQCAARLDAELESWRTRPLATCAYLILDARYEKVRHGGRVLDCAVLIALGIRPDGRRSVLGVSVALSEAEVHWREFLQSLQKRGLHGVQLIVSDDHAGLRAARAAVFPAVPWQRCQFHLQQNAQAYVPRLDQRAAVAEAVRSVFASPDRPSAERRLQEIVTTYMPTAPKLAAWLEENLPKASRSSRCRAAATPPAHEQRAGTGQPGTGPAHPRGPALSQRSLVAAAGHSLARRVERRLGNRKNLSQHGRPKPVLNLMLNEFTETNLLRPENKWTIRPRAVHCLRWNRT